MCASREKITQTDNIMTNQITLSSCSVSQARRLASAHVSCGRVYALSLGAVLCMVRYVTARVEC